MYARKCHPYIPPHHKSLVPALVPYQIRKYDTSKSIFSNFISHAKIMGNTPLSQHFLPCLTPPIFGGFDPKVDQLLPTTENQNK